MYRSPNNPNPGMLIIAFVSMFFILVTMWALIARPTAQKAITSRNSTLETFNNYMDSWPHGNNKF